MESGSKDYMRLEIPSLSRNESFARAVIAAFAARLDPTLEEISDIKTAVSEAVTNAVIHAYENEIGPIIFYACIENSDLIVEVTDQGQGIPDLEKVKQPFYTSKPEMERSGMGFTIMDSFMDELTVITGQGEGTTVRMVKKISAKSSKGDAVNGGQNGVSD